MLSKEHLRLSSSSGALKEPEMHAMALVDRVEPDPQARNILVVHAQLNLTGSGKHAPVFSTCLQMCPGNAARSSMQAVSKPADSRGSCGGQLKLLTRACCHRPARQSG